MFVIGVHDDPVAVCDDKELAEKYAKHINGWCSEVPVATGCHVHYMGRLSYMGIVSVSPVHTLVDESTECVEMVSNKQIPWEIVKLSYAATEGRAKQLLEEPCS